MNESRLLIAGIGNIFLGDDAFGVEVARQLLGRRLPAEARVVDFGIRSLDLVYALLDGYEQVILVDAAPRGEPPGTLYVIEPEDNGAEPPCETLQPEQVEMHGMDPRQVLRLARALGATGTRILLVGCEPETLGTMEQPVMGLSRPVRSAVGEAVSLIESLVAQFAAAGDAVRA